MSSNDELLLVATRKLTENETNQLRSLLKSELNISNSSNSQQAEEDAADLLDYAFAMIANGKNVGYVAEEVSLFVCTTCCCVYYFDYLSILLYCRDFKLFV